MIKTIYGRKHLIGACLQIQGVIPCLSWWQTQWQADMYGEGAIKFNLHPDIYSQETEAQSMIGSDITPAIRPQLF